MRAYILSLLVWSMAFNSPIRADILNLANGDRYIGSVELVNAAEVQLKSETLGLVKIPRGKVASIYFGTNQPSAKAAFALEKEPAAALGIDPKSIEKVQEEFLATATPEANEMFKELVQGIASGKLSVQDIRNQARQSLQELKDLQAEIGDEDGNALLSSYVGILERFINQGTNRAKAMAPKPAAPVRKPTDDE